MQIIFFISLFYYLKAIHSIPFPIFYASDIDLSKQQIYQSVIIENGDSQDEFFGYAVSKSLCDINGDKVNDLVVFAKNTYSITRYVYVFFGGFFENRNKISASEINGTNGFRISYTDDSNVNDATFVDCLGDLNNDGTDEIGLGASYTNSSYNIAPGTMYVIYGSKKIHNPILIDCDSLKPNIGFQITDNKKCQSSIALQFTRMGDMNGDKYDDFAFNCEPNIVIIIYGRNQFLGEYNISSMENVEIFDRNSIYKSFGSRISSNLDINNDGFNDLMILARDFKNFPIILIFLGSIGNFQEDFVYIKGEDENTKFDLTFLTIGDINGDNLDDILLSDTGYNRGAGKFYIIYGNRKPKTIFLWNISNTQGFSIKPEANGMCLTKISYFGNIIGSKQNSVGIGMGSCGTYQYAQSVFHIVHGGVESEIFPKDLSKLNGKNGVSFRLNYDSLLGMSSGPIGNFLGKGTQAIMISLPDKTVNNIPNSGQILIIQTMEFCKSNGEFLEGKSVFEPTKSACTNSNPTNSSGSTNKGSNSYNPTNSSGSIDNSSNSYNFTNSSDSIDNSSNSYNFTNSSGSIDNRSNSSHPSSGSTNKCSNSYGWNHIFCNLSFSIFIFLYYLLVS